MSYLHAIILGLAQGLAEFLPISSSGHLTILQHFFGIEGDSVVIFTILMHVGTLAAVFIIYWADIWALIKELFLTIWDLIRFKGLKLKERPVRKLGVMIIIASIPTAIIGLGFQDMFEGFYETLLPTGIGLIITGIILWIAENPRKQGKGIEQMTWAHAVIIGTLQGVAITPGISSSGSTLFGGLITGLDRAFAVEFAFLISIPSVLGSLILESDGAMESVLSNNMGPIVVGFIVSLLSGIFAIKVMITIVKKYSLRYFSAYVWVVGAFLIGYTLFM
ncbi:MAG: undecaprenyl-diphosphate phosphatase [Clostridiales bacterium]|nr:undecaprenyl-diphosphate phosphatase [Candidatus Crickella merdequi]